MKKILLISGSILIVIGIAFVYFFLQRPLTKPQPATDLPISTPIAGQNTSFQKNVSMDKYVTTQQQESTTPVTQLEKQYPTGVPQDFSYQKTTDMGTLVVTTNPTDARIVIDALTGGETNSMTVPNNQSPFVIAQIPAGYYSILAQKTGYSFEDLIVRIDPYHVTRLSITMPKVAEAQ